MKKKLFYIAILISMLCSLVAAQQEQTQLDPRRYEAWTVEYEPYRLLVENAVMEYISVSGDKIPPINPGDILIAIRNKGRKSELYQLRYGTPMDGFTIISGSKVKWILGSTLISTIADKDKYYNLDSRLPFQEKTRKPELDYLNTELFWTNTDFMLGLDRSVYRFGATGGILFEWGSELLCRPYGDAGFMRLGVVTPVFKLGLQMPSLVNLGIHQGEKWQRLNGGFGGFGAFNYSNLYGELSFLTNSGSMAMDPSVNSTGKDHINFMDIAGLFYLNFGAPFTKLKGAFQIKPGFTLQRIAHRKVVTNPAGDDVLADQTIDRDDNEFEGGAEDYFGGFFLRLDYASALAKASVPKFLFTLQVSGNTGILSKFTLNLNESISIPFTVVYYTADNDWTPKGIATHVGIQFRLRNVM